MLEEANDIPKLCHAIEEYLFLPDEKRTIPLDYFLTADAFERWVAEEVGIALCQDEKKVAIEYLDSAGIIMKLESRLICVRPSWLCHNVIGPLLSLRYFPFDKHKRIEKSGEASLEDIEWALEEFLQHLKEQDIPSPFSVTAKEATNVLVALELCIPVEKIPGLYQIPALLHDSIPVDTWGKDSRLDVYRGQRYECRDLVDIISPSSLVVLQSRCSRMTDVSYKMWKDGIKLRKLVDDKEVECLIKMGVKNGHHCIDVILRWSSKAACKVVAKKFLDELKLMITGVCDEKSPGVILNWFYLDSSHLQRLDQDPAIYSSGEVDQKVSEKAFKHLIFSTRPEKESCSPVQDLVVSVSETSFASGSFPTDEEPVSEHLLRACASVDGADWEKMSLVLGISSDDRYNIRKTGSSVEIFRLSVLELWKKQTEAPKVGVLLRLLRNGAGISRREIEAKFGDLFGHL